VKTWKDEIQTLENSVAQHTAEKSNLPVQQRESAVRDLRQQLLNTKAQVSSFMSRAKDLRLQSYQVGLHLLDQNNSGSLEPEDVPSMSLELFSLLDINNNHSITPTELVRVITDMDAEIEALEKEKLVTIAEGNARSSQLATTLANQRGADAKALHKLKRLAEKLEVDVVKANDTVCNLDRKIEKIKFTRRSITETFEDAFESNILVPCSSWDCHFRLNAVAPLSIAAPGKLPLLWKTHMPEESAEARASLRAQENLQCIRARFTAEVCPLEEEEQKLDTEPVEQSQPGEPSQKYESIGEEEEEEESMKETVKVEEEEVKESERPSIIQQTGMAA